MASFFMGGCWMKQVFKENFSCESKVRCLSRERALYGPRSEIG